MHTLPRIEDTPAALAKLQGCVARQSYTDALNQFFSGDYSIAEETVEGFGPRFAAEVRLFAGSREAMLGKRILIRTVQIEANVKTHERATYAFRHHDMMMDFNAAISALMSHRRSVTRADASPEFYAHCEERLRDPGFADRVRNLVDFSKETIQ